MTPPLGLPVPVFMVVHPAAALRNRFVRRWFEADMAWALTVNVPDPVWDAPAWLVENEDDARAAVAALRTCEWAAFDVETAGCMFDPSFRVLCVSLCGRGRDDAYVWTKDGLANPAARGVLLDYMRDENAPKAGQNVKFDCVAFFAAYGVMPRGVALDSRLMRKLLESDADGRLAAMAELVGLGGHKEEAETAKANAVKMVNKALRAVRKTNPDAYELAEFRDPPEDAPALDRMVASGEHETDKWSFAFIPNRTLYRYNARDSVTTARLCEMMWRALDAEPDLRRTWHRLVRPASEAIAQVEAWGIGADRDALRVFDTWCSVRAQELGEKLNGYFSGVNWDSPKQVADILFNKLGLPPQKETKSGGDSTDADVLDALKTHHPLPATLLEYRRVSKMRGTYASGMLPHVRADGRIHPNLNLDGARSGRTSSSDPNLQNIPRAQTEEGTMARNVFCAPPGHVLVEADYCLAPGTRVLTADLRWQPIEEVEVGQELVGFDEDLGGHKCSFRGAVVQATKRLVQPCYRVVTSRGQCIASAMHGWVVRPKLGRQVRAWVQTQELRVGDKISFFADPWEEDTSWMGGYLSGFLDGEGWVSDGGRCVGFGQNDGAVFAKVCAELRARGFMLDIDKNQNGCNRVRVAGEKAGLRLLGMLRPSRLMAGVRAGWDGRRTWGKKSKPAVVLAVEYLGERDVVAVQTSTRTFIAEGFLTHNSQIELRVAAALSGDEKMRAIFREGVDYHLRTAQLVSRVAWGIAPEDVTDKHRSWAKGINFGLLYGQGDDELARTMGCKKSEAARVREAILGKFRKLDRWCQECLAEARRTGEAWTWWDGHRARRRNLWRVADKDDLARSKAEHASWNTPVQGTASDFLVASLVAVVAWILEDAVPAKVVVPVHDSIMLETREENVEEVIWQLGNIMQGFNCQGVPLVVDFKVGRAWGAMEKRKA
jgi:DNA polymerase I-like protein with 3'-5' exonuclease and polymerase domains